MVDSKHCACTLLAAENLQSQTEWSGQLNNSGESNGRFSQQLKCEECDSRHQNSNWNHKVSHHIMGNRNQPSKSLQSRCQSQAQRALQSFPKTPKLQSAAFDGLEAKVWMKTKKCAKNSFLGAETEPNPQQTKAGIPRLKVLHQNNQHTQGRTDVAVHLKAHIKLLAINPLEQHGWGMFYDMTNILWHDWQKKRSWTWIWAFRWLRNEKKNGCPATDFSSKVYWFHKIVYIAFCVINSNGASGTTILPKIM